MEQNFWVLAPTTIYVYYTAYTVLNTAPLSQKAPASCLTGTKQPDYLLCRGQNLHFLLVRLTLISIFQRKNGVCLLGAVLALVLSLVSFSYNGAFVLIYNHFRKQPHFSSHMFTILCAPSCVHYTHYTHWPMCTALCALSYSFHLCPTLHLAPSLGGTHLLINLTLFSCSSSSRFFSRNGFILWGAVLVWICHELPSPRTFFSFIYNHFQKSHWHPISYVYANLAWLLLGGPTLVVFLWCVTFHVFKPIFCTFYNFRIKN